MNRILRHQQIQLIMLLSVAIWYFAVASDNAGATYLLSDGYGGLHALLFGVANLNTSESARYQLFGNLNDRRHRQ